MFLGAGPAAGSGRRTAHAPSAAGTIPRGTDATIDFFGNLSQSRPKRDYFVTRRDLPDLLGSVPSLGFFRFTALLRLARLGRLVRISRLLRGENKKALVEDVVKNRGQCAASITVLSALIVLVVASIFVLQFESRSPGANITNGGDALWWTVVTITTVGHGDKYPVRELGRMTGWSATRARIITRSRRGTAPGAPRLEGDMVRRRDHGASCWMRWGVGLAAAIAMLVSAPSAFAAAPKTTHAAAYDLMRKFMEQYDKDGFAKVVDYGASKAYRVKLATLRFKVDSTLKPIAKYDPVTKTLTLSKDPRKVTAAESAAFGETVWHEVTHSFEDQHGDIGLLDSAERAERNVDYMTHVIKVALPRLDQLERMAKAGASVEKLRAVWQKYLKAMEDAAKLPSTTAYPPDLKLMREWFGFRANPDDIRKLYLSGKALPGKQGENLRKALAPAFKPEDWAGVWTGYDLSTFCGDLTLTVSGTSVTGVWAYHPGRCGEQFQGTLSTDAGTMTGTWLEDTNLISGPEHYVKTFNVHLVANADGSLGFEGYMYGEDPSIHTRFNAERR